MNPTERGLLDEIKATLMPAARPSYTNSTAGFDLFEAYIFCLVIQAAKEMGATVTYKDQFDRDVRLFILRTGPGRIWSFTKNYCHAVIEFENKPALEAHVGVRVAGTSKVLSECDVSVIQRSECQMCRASRTASGAVVSPRSSKLILGVECKFYVWGLRLSLARSFIGLLSDFSGKPFFFVSNISSDSVEQLLTHKKKSWHSNIVPSASSSVEILRHFIQKHIQGTSKLQTKLSKADRRVT